MSLMKLGDFSFEFGSIVTILTTAAAGLDRLNRHSSKGIFTGILLDKNKLKTQSGMQRISVKVDAKYTMEEDCKGDYKDDYKEDYSKDHNHKEDNKEDFKEEKPYKEKKPCKDEADYWSNTDESEEYNEAVEICPMCGKEKWPKSVDWEWPQHSKGKYPKCAAEFPKYSKKKWPDTEEWQQAEQSEWPESTTEQWAKSDKQGYNSTDKSGKKQWPDKAADHGQPTKQKNSDEFLVLSLIYPSYPYYPGQIVWININEIVAAAVLNHKK